MNYFATPLDVRSFHWFADDLESAQISSNAYLMMCIWHADNTIRLKLNKIIGGNEDRLKVTPYSSYPLPDRNNLNAATAYLTGITANTTAITETWTITFTAATTFTVAGSLSGSQGTGGTGVDFTSTNGFIVIPHANWVGTFATDDIVYVNTYNIKNTIVGLSSVLAACQAMDSLYSESVPNEQRITVSLRRYAMNTLDDIAAGLLTMDNAVVDTQALQQFYEVDKYGNDITGYKIDELNRYTPSNQRGW